MPQGFAAPTQIEDFPDWAKRIDAVQMKTGLLVPAIALLAACQQPAAVSVDKAWVRMTPVHGAPSGAYFTLKGGAKEETLTGIAAPDATRAEMHDSTDKGGISRMGDLKSLAIRPGETITFSPGNKHVMLFGLKPTVKPGTTTPLTFSFASGKKILCHRTHTFPTLDADLTLKHITQIKDAFVGQLLGMYHSRIKYPDNVVPMEPRGAGREQA